MEIHVGIEILEFPKIDTLGLSFSSDFELLMRWVDPRLTFFDLRELTELNSLSSRIQSGIWSTKLGFTNAKIIGGTLVDDTTATIVEKMGCLLQMMFHEVLRQVCTLEQIAISFRRENTLLTGPATTTSSSTHLIRKYVR